MPSVTVDLTCLFLEASLFFASLAGVLIPWILNSLSIDPALAGGVILTTVTDIIGFAAFLGLATVFLLNYV